MTSPSSPRRHRETDGANGGKDERPRFFDLKAKAKCWANAEIVPGRHPERWRKDAAGNIVCKRFCNCQGCLCFEYDHIVPYSKGGESVAENCQILQTRVNRMKSDKERVDSSQLHEYSCDIKFNAVEDMFDTINQCSSVKFGLYYIFFHHYIYDSSLPAPLYYGMLKGMSAYAMALRHSSSSIPLLGRLRISEFRVFVFPLVTYFVRYKARSQTSLQN